MYRAVRVHQFGGPEQLVVDELPALKPAAGQVLVAIKAAGVNPVDTYIRTGTYIRKPELPYTPGADGAGVVEAVGEGVQGISVGERVYLAGSITGTYASQALCTPAQIHRLPDNVSFEQGAALNVPYVTAHRALFTKGKAKAGETVLVHGASGGVGVAAVQLARDAGLTVVGTAGSAEGVEMVKKQGAHHAFSHREEGYLDKVMEATGNKGVNIILEMLANVNLGKDLPLLADNGRVAIVGNRGTVEINPRDLMSREASVFGIAMAKQTPAEAKEAHDALFDGLSRGALVPVVGKTVPLDAAADAHRDVISQAGSTQGKIILVP